MKKALMLGLMVAFVPMSSLANEDAGMLASAKAFVEVCNQLNTQIKKGPPKQTAKGDDLAFGAIAMGQIACMGVVEGVTAGMTMAETYKVKDGGPEVCMKATSAMTYDDVLARATEIEKDNRQDLAAQEAGAALLVLTAIATLNKCD